MARTIILMCAPEAAKQTLTAKGALQAEFVARAAINQRMIPDKILFSDQPGADEASLKMKAIFVEAGKEVLIEKTEWLQNGFADQKDIRKIGYVARPTYPQTVLMITGAGNFTHLTRQFHFFVKSETTRPPFAPAPGLAHVFTNRQTDTWLDFTATPGKVERLAVISPPK